VGFLYPFNPSGSRITVKV